MSIFKAYDVRGKYPSELNETNARAIGWAYIKFLKTQKKFTSPPNIAVARDVRLSSLPLAKALIQGMTEGGARITDIGSVTTPMCYFADGFYHFDGAIMVTASHNPPEYNGFKICRENAIAFSEMTGLQDIKKLSETYKPSGQPRQVGNVTTLNILPDYRNFIRGFFNFGCQTSFCKKTKVVIDTTNGNVGPVFEAVFNDIVGARCNVPLQVFPLCFEPDGRFPNHEPNPMKDENIRDITKAVKKHKADLGVAFDGDGDRVIFLNEKAERIPNDFITALIAEEILRESKKPQIPNPKSQIPKMAIVYDLRSSKAVAEIITKAGGKPVRERVGHAFIKATMRKYNAPFGGELSGHYYYRDNFFADNAMLTFVHILNIMAREEKSISKIVKSALGDHNYFASGELNFEVSDKEAKMKELARIFSDGKIDYLDGVTVEYKDWWFNVRPSNTEPLLRLNIEATTNKQLQLEKKKIEKILKER